MGRSGAECSRREEQVSEQTIQGGKLLGMLLEEEGGQ